jgi:membrane protein DedA with SNARE-associated domain
MDVNHLLLAYGPLVILVWTFFEGETVLLVAGFLAHQGYISLEWSILAAFIGSMSGDQLYFWVGRKFGEQILDWRPVWRVRIERPLRMLVKYQNLFILSFRFIYVVRNVASFSIGLAGVSFKRFAILNAIAAAIWALSFGLGGYWFGSTLKTIAGGVQEIETFAFVAAAFSLGGYLIWRRARRQASREGSRGVPEPSGNE